MGEKSAKAVIASGAIMVLAGIALVIYGVSYYHSALCNCPAEIVGMPQKPCMCINTLSVFIIEMGLLLIVVGAWWMALGAHRRLPFTVKGARYSKFRK
ncbi:MAG: hypothetical protein QXW10_04455 [Candidatus Micrarchaeaceae archaeon]